MGMLAAPHSECMLLQHARSSAVIGESASAQRMVGTSSATSTANTTPACRRPLMPSPWKRFYLSARTSMTAFGEYLVISIIRCNRANRMSTEDPTRLPTNSDIQVLHIQRILFNELAARLDILTHQRGKDRFRLRNVLELD
jgi:hypothetical protein